MSFLGGVTKSQLRGLRIGSSELSRRVSWKGTLNEKVEGLDAPCYHTQTWLHQGEHYWLSASYREPVQRAKRLYVPPSLSPSFPPSLPPFFFSEPCVKSSTSQLIHKKNHLEIFFSFVVLKKWFPLQWTSLKASVHRDVGKLLCLVRESSVAPSLCLSSWWTLAVHSWVITPVFQNLCRFLSPMKTAVISVFDKLAFSIDL